MQQVPPPPQRKDHVVNAHTEMAEATCNATGTEKSISAVPIVPVLLRMEFQDCERGKDLWIYSNANGQNSP